MTDMDRPPRTLLEQLVRQSSRTVEETCADFEATGRRLGEDVTLSPRQLGRWMAGIVEAARPVSKRVAEEHWGYGFEMLVGAPLLSVEQSARRYPHPAPTYITPDQLEAAASMAAHESSRHAASVGGGVDPNSIEQTQQSIVNLARQYHELPPIGLLGRARRTRDLAYLLLERTRRPAQEKDLFLVAGQACGLMALASFDLAIWDAAEEQARAARTYAELADHAGLRAWAHGTQALVAFWSGQPRRAVNFAQVGAELAPAGKQLARLRGIEARSWAYLGNASAVNDALQAADEAMDEARGDDDMMDFIGGEFGWGASLHAACAGTALLVLGDGETAAVRVRAAIEAMTHDPSAGLVPERAQIDLAGAELLAGHLDRAESALEPIWPIPVPYRRHGLTGRLEGVGRTLVNARWRDDPAAGELRDRIEVFNFEATASRALPSA